MATFYNPDKTAGDPVMAAISSGQYRDIPKNIVEGYTSQNVSQEDTLAKIKGTPVYDPTKGPQIDYGQGKTQLPVGAYDFSDPAKLLAAEKGGMTKDSLQAILSAGSDPANRYTPATSQGSKIDAAMTAVPVSTSFGGTTATDTTAASTAAAGTTGATGVAPTYTDKTGKVVSTGIPYPDIGAKPEALSPDLKSQVLAQYGVPDIQTNIDNIDKQIADLTAKEAADVQAAMAAPVSSSIRSKLGAKAKAGVAQELATLRAQRTELTRQKSEQTQAVSLYMSEAGKTYSQAVAEWNAENSANKAAITAMDKTSTDEVKTAKVNAQTILNGLKPNQQLTPDQKNYIDEQVIRAYGPEFQGIEQSGLSGVLYSHSVKGGDGKSYLMTVHGNPDGTVSVKWTAPTSVAKAQAKTFTSTQYKQIQGGFGISSDEVNTILGAIQKGTDLETIRGKMRDSKIDPAALDWIMHYYDPIHNAKPGA